MNVVIPSSGRANRQTTLEQIPWAIVVVPMDEVKAYDRYDPVGCPADGIGHTRQWIVDNFGPKVLMLDDDLTFFIRRAEDRTKFRHTTADERTAMLGAVSDRLDNYVHVSIATREGGNRNTDEYAYNTRTLRALAYNTEVLRSERIRFDRMSVMEDFDVNLSLLTKGFENCVVNSWVHDQHGSQTAGGCSQYRTMEMQSAAAEALAARYPEFVTVVERTTKTAWGGGTRKDVRIQWKKALASHRSTRRGKDYLGE